MIKGFVQAVWHGLHERGAYTYHGHRNSEQELMKGMKPELGKGIRESKRDKPKELAVEVPRATQGLPEGADVPRV